jgi:hypothetical protein
MERFKRRGALFAVTALGVLALVPAGAFAKISPRSCENGGGQNPPGQQPGCKGEGLDQNPATAPQVTLLQVRTSKPLRGEKGPAHVGPFHARAGSARSRGDFDGRDAPRPEAYASGVASLGQVATPTGAGRRWFR